MLPDVNVQKKLISRSFLFLLMGKPLDKFTGKLLAMINNVIIAF